MPRRVIKASSPITMTRLTLTVPAVSQIQGMPEANQAPTECRSATCVMLSACASMVQRLAYLRLPLAHDLRQRIDRERDHEQHQRGQEEDAIVGAVDFRFRHLDSDVGRQCTETLKMFKSRSGYCPSP